MEGGDELYDSCMVIDTFTGPAGSAVRSGRDLCSRQAAQRAEQKIKKIRSGSMAVKKENADMAAYMVKRGMYFAKNWLHFREGIA